MKLPARFTSERPEWIPAEYLHAELVGRGGEGEVWRARAAKGPSPVAIKRFDPSLRRHGYREFSAMVRIRDENVLSVYDVVDTQTGDLLLVSEYCSGGTLRRFLTSNPMLEPVQAVDLARQILGGLRAIHRAGLVHADLKPENIFRTRNIDRPVWKIADFGLSRRDAEAAKGPISLTPAYAAPEQYENAACQASDIYALGLILGEAATGLRPRRGHHRDLVGQIEDLQLREFAMLCTDLDPRHRPTAAQATIFLADFRNTARLRRHVSDSAWNHAQTRLNAVAAGA